jgi:hypothetical protein
VTNVAEPDRIGRPALIATRLVLRRVAIYHCLAR